MTLRPHWLLATCLVLTPLSACEGDDRCGDGRLDPGESCDGTELRGATCAQLGFARGTLACSAECRYDTSGCEGLVSCGDGVIDPGEQCDGDDLRGETCESQQLGGGTLACDPVTCQLDIGGCEGGGLCGDGVAQGAEECDGDDLRGLDCPSADASFLGGALSCSASCRLVTTRCWGEPDYPLGEPCEADADCPGGSCFPEVSPWGFGAPGGMCMEDCDADDTCPLSGGAGLCVDLGYGGSRCFPRCDPATPEACRPGYACFLSGSEGYCFPACTHDNQCERTHLCDADSGGFSEGFCLTPEEVCSGGEDEDFDGLVDCADPDCTGLPACPTGELCGNGIDDDGDDHADCDDAECASTGLCRGEICAPLPAPILGCGASLVAETNDASGHTNVVLGASCTDPAGGPETALSGADGPERAYRLTVSAPQVVTVHLGGLSANLDLYVLKAAPGGLCDPYQRCFAYGHAPATQDETVTFAAYPGTDYFVVVDGVAGAVGSYDLSVTCEGAGFEECGNGVDDDGDGLVDCDDPECAWVPPHCL